MKESPHQDAFRHRLYRLLVVGKRALHMEEDSYRALLERHGASLIGDKYSATTMTIDGLKAAVEEMRSKGFQVATKARPSRPNPADTHITNASEAQLDLMRYIWREMGKTGVLRDPTERGLQAWVRASTRRRAGTGYERLEFLPHDVAQELIERLKNWAARANVELHLHG